MGPVFGPLKGTRFWMFCEHFIRRAAGLGRAGYAKDTARYERMNAFCDVLVVGSGPAGLMAAKAAAEQRRSASSWPSSTPRFGGSANWSGETIDGMPAADWAARTVERTWPSAAMSGCSAAPRSGATTTATRWPRWSASPTTSAVAGKGEPRHRHWTIRAGAVVLATGAFERPLVFPGNDRPGVMLAGAAERYANEFGVLPGDKVAVFTNNDSAYRAAAALPRRAAAIAAIVDVRAEISPAARSLAAEAGAELLTGHAVVATEGGKARVRRQGAALRRGDAARCPAMRAPSPPTACWSRAAGRR